MTPNGERHRALLARSPNGRTETFMLLHGCTRQQLDGLISARLAIATDERVGHGRQMATTRIRITEERPRGAEQAKCTRGSQQAARPIAAQRTFVDPEH
jgi:hypothetical protein